MGAIRSIPDQEVRVAAEKRPDLNFVEASVCGWQHHMEDFSGSLQLSSNLSAFFVLDGHGGPDLAELALQEIPDLLRNNEAIQQQKYKTGLEEFCRSLDRELFCEGKRASVIREKHGLPPLMDPFPSSGFSMVIALVGEAEIAIANLGECKCYVCYSSNPSKAVLISGNHTEGNSEDEARVKNAGGFFLNGRLNGVFPFTRSIGDYSFKKNDGLGPGQQLLSHIPSIFSLRKQDIKAVVLGSSGVWEEPGQVMKELTEDDCELNELKMKSERLLSSMVSKEPRDGTRGMRNMSLLMIDLKH